MGKETFKDLEIVHQYMDTVTTFIQNLVQNESLVIMLACQVFEDYKKKEVAKSFKSEENRLAWLIGRARKVAVRHLKYESGKKIKTKAICAAIHDCP